MLSYYQRLVLAKREVEEFHKLSIRARFYEHTEYKKLKPLLNDEKSSCLL